uniref:Uncharacterized protein n=1 Tax=Gadus morhua TaxID=8049 RepID=A0A8C5BQI4_GADMO
IEDIHVIKMYVCISIISLITFHPFQWRNWTPQAMLYLKGASKLHINLTLRLTKNGCYRTVIMICLNIRITTMGQIAMRLRLLSDVNVL